MLTLRGCYEEIKTANKQNKKYSGVGDLCNSFLTSNWLYFLFDAVIPPPEYPLYLGYLKQLRFYIFNAINNLDETIEESMLEDTEFYILGSSDEKITVKELYLKIIEAIETTRDKIYY